MKCMHRPAKILSDPFALDQEFRAARWIHHRLLDFEDEHQAQLDRVAQECAPGILACGRIIARLGRREERRTRSSKGTWSPDPRPELKERLKERLEALRKARNADPRWKEALKWADRCEPDAPSKGPPRRRKAKDPSKVKRRKKESEEKFVERFERLTRDETDEEFEARTKKRENRQSRREYHRAQIYDKHVASSKTSPIIYWGTWNALLASVEQARKAVIEARTKGLPADWHRPRWDKANTLSATATGFRIVERGKPWWVVEMRLSSGWVRFRCKFGNWHDLPEKAQLKECKLTRRKRGNGWAYSVSVSVEGMPANDDAFAAGGVVALDWGHREHGHDAATEGLRVFTWKGDDGEEGEILLPRRCRDLLDKTHETLSRMDKIFEARKKTFHLPDKNRHAYRKRMRRSGVVDRDAAEWFRWETRYERRVSAMRRKIQNIRKETFIQAARMLRRHYKVFAIEDEKSWSHKKRAQDEMEKRRKRQNRDLSARYEFTQICERLGAKLLPVPSRNSTKECPHCGHLSENTAELLIACEGCGIVRDKDYGACIVIMKRAQEALANEAAE